MIPLTDTPLRLAWMPFQVTPPDDSLTLIVKGSYRLAHGQLAQILEETEQLLPGGDEPISDEPNAALRYASDFVAFKPRADLLLAGKCHAPNDEAIDLCEVKFSVGDRSRSLVVFGDRVWKPGLLGGWSASDPIPFRTMELDYGLSFGGPDSPRNSAGRGWGRHQAGEFLPNIEDLHHLVTSPNDHDEPAGFGPLSPLCEQRCRGMGTYDKKWLDKRWPWYPADFDWTHCNAAPEAMQREGYLRGDEALAFEHMHAEHATYEAQMPGHRPRCFVNRETEDGSEFVEVALSLDTLFVDMETETLVLVWRGRTPVLSQEFEELSHAYVALEQLADPAASLEEHRAAFEAMREPPADEEEAAGDEEDAEAAAALQAEIAEQQSAAIAESAETIKGIAEQLAKAGAPPNVLAALQGEADPTVALEKMIAAANLADAPTQTELASIDAETVKRNREAFQKLGLDTKVLDDLDAAQAEVAALDAAAEADAASERPKLTREEVESHREDHRLLNGADLSELDLTGLDLSGVDLRDTLLRGANLAGVSLGQAILSGADLSTADLTGANLAAADLSAAQLGEARLGGCDLTGAILADAKLVGADLTEACLQDANLAGCDLSDATLVGMKAPGVDLTAARLASVDLASVDLASAQCSEAIFENVTAVEAILDGALFEGATLTGCDWSGASCVATNFAGCEFEACSFAGVDLTDACFEGADGVGLVFKGATMTGVRAGEATNFADCDFDEVSAAGAIFSGSSLARAKFRRADLTLANLSDADMTGSDCLRANMKQGNLSRTILIDASLMATNLMEARLEKADLTSTDFTASNLYGAEFLDATIAETRFDGADLARTKLGKS